MKWHIIIGIVLISFLLIGCSSMEKEVTILKEGLGNYSFNEFCTKFVYDNYGDKIECGIIECNDRCVCYSNCECENIKYGRE